VTIYLNPRLVDYNKDVRIVHNNRVTICRRPKRDLQVVEATIRQRGDFDYIFQDFLVSIPAMTPHWFVLPLFFQLNYTKDISKFEL
jgi:hypothetical protein